MAKCLNLCPRVVLRNKQVGRVAGQEQERERDKAHAREDRQRVHETTSDVTEHRALRPGNWSPEPEQQVPLPGGSARVEEQHLAGDVSSEVLQLASPKIAKA